MPILQCEKQEISIPDNLPFNSGFSYLIEWFAPSSVNE